MRKLLYFCGFLIIASGFLYYVVEKGIFDVSSIEVQVLSSLPENHEPLKSHTKKVLDKMKGHSLLKLSLESLHQDLIEDKRIKRAEIQRRFPNKLIVSIEPHKAKLNMMAVKFGLHSITNQGEVLPVPLSDQKADLPILRGINFHKDKGLRIKALNMMAQIPKEGLFKQSNISEVRFVEESGFFLYMVEPETVVKFGKDKFTKKSSYIERAMNYLRSQKLDGRVIDARFAKKVVVKLRNEL